MYKREDVYQILGFDQFISECMMIYMDMIENNLYIFDELVYKEVMIFFKEEKIFQFIYLVMMQIYMFYNGKYDRLGYFVEILDGSGMFDLENYL